MMTIKTTVGSGGETVAFAAKELERYLSRMLRGEGTVHIRLRCKEGPVQMLERFDVHLTPDGGEITGNSPRAVLLAVYDALRRLGCRFLAPGRENEVVPCMDAAQLSLDYAHTARFAHRGVCIEGANSRENVLSFIDWLPKIGLNAFFLQFQVPYVFYARWYEHRLNPTLPPVPFERADALTLTREAEEEVRRRGLTLHKVGHGWTGAVLGYEAISWDEAPPLPDARRPLAAQVGDKRDLFGRVPQNTNLCLSNPEATARFVTLVAEYAAQNPDVDCLHIWLADAYNNVCECPLCQRSTPSDQYVALLNAVDARLNALGLDTKLVFLLYQELLWPPVRERLNNPDRFILMFAPISRSFDCAYPSQSDGGAIPPYVRNAITLPVNPAENLRFLRGWQALFGGDSFVYDYPLGRAHYGDAGYLHIARVIFEDIGKLHALGLGGYISCQELRAGMPNFLPNYVMGRALFDADADFDAVAREYFEAAYGQQWRSAMAFLDALSANHVCDYLNGKGPRVNAGAAQRLARAQSLCEAFTPAQNGPFWDRLALHARITALLCAALRAQAEGHVQESRSAYGAFLALVREQEMRNQPFLDVYRVIEVTQNYAGLTP